MVLINTCFITPGTVDSIRNPDLAVWTTIGVVARVKHINGQQDLTIFRPLRQGFSADQPLEAGLRNPQPPTEIGQWDTAIVMCMTSELNLILGEHDSSHVSTPSL